MTVSPDRIFERVRPWLEPIAGPLPGGTPARDEPACEAVLCEVAKLESPAGGEVDWRAVAEGAGELLRTRTKDLLLASYLAHALHVTEGAEGLAAGMALLVGLVEGHWDALHPEARRVRARAEAIQWFVARTAGAVPASTSVLGAGEVALLEAGARRLAELSRQKLASAAPAFGPLLEALEQARRSAPEAVAKLAQGEAAREAPEAPPGNGAAAEAASGSAASAASASPRVDSLGAGQVGELASSADATEFLRGIGGALVQASEALRRADSRDPVAYRVLRTGLWIHLEAPPASAGGQTPVAPPPPALRQQLAAMAAHQRLAELVEEAESALPRNRFALDLHRLSFQGLTGLGAAHVRAREAVAGEVRALLGRMPRLLDLTFADGTPFADGPTRAWVGELIAPAAPPASRGNESGEARPEAEERVREARRLLAAGDMAALALLQEEVLKERDGRGRFLARLELARACEGAGLAPLALAVYEDLEREASVHQLDGWEARLVRDCLAGLLGAARACGKELRAEDPRLSEHLRRLCRIDPAAAHKVWPCVNVTK